MGFPIKKYKHNQHNEVLIKFWQNINEELLKIEYLIILSQYFGIFTQEFFCCVTSSLPLQDFQNIG